jgi:hypothetical protein
MAWISVKRSLRFPIPTVSFWRTRLTAGKSHDSSVSGTLDVGSWPCDLLIVAAKQFGLLVPVIGEKAGKFMKSGKVKYTDDKGEMAGEFVRIKDFLPPANEPVESVTVTLRGDVLAFFQHEASRRNTSYQRIVRDLFRSYARSHAPAKS